MNAYMRGVLWFHLFCGGALPYVCMVLFDLSAAFMGFCKPHKVEDHVLRRATVTSRCTRQ